MVKLVLAVNLALLMLVQVVILMFLVLLLVVSLIAKANLLGQTLSVRFVERRTITCLPWIKMASNA